MSTPKLLRLALGVGLLVLSLAFGGLARSPVLVFPLSLVFAISYVGGKWPQWRTWSRTASTSEVLKGLAITLLIQLVVVSLFFFVAYGLVSILAPRPFAPVVTFSDLAVLTAAAVVSLFGMRALNAAEARPASEPGAARAGRAGADEREARPHVEEEGDLVMSQEAVTVANFFAGRHFSAVDHMQKALVGWSEGDAKVERVPVAATEAMLREAEARLGVSLPDTLRSLYLQRDGGALPTYWVPATADPGTDFDDWISAFATDYDDLRPLKALHFLIEDLEDADLEDEDDRDEGIPGADKLVILTRRYGVATLLDYREGPTAPGVLLVDLEQEGDARVLKRYETFDAFFSELRKEDEDRGPGGRVSSGPLDRSRLAPHGYDPDQPARFWANSNANATRGVSDEDWRAAEARLGVRLPPPFRALYAVLDGGSVGYPFLDQLGVDARGEPRSPFAGTRSVKTLLPLAAWISLADLSDRLCFPAATPYRQLHERPQRLIVLSAAFDTALLLDARGETEPRVRSCPDLTRPETCVDLGSAETFLSALRQRSTLAPLDSLPIADSRLAPRVADVETFWTPGMSAVGATDAALAQVAERFGAEVPDGLVPFLKKHNGGRVRFRFAPPIADPGGDPMRLPRSDPRHPEWIDLFPGGLWPVEDWVRFSEFCGKHVVALEQDPREVLMPELRTEPDVTQRLLVIGADGHAAITLLDLSAGFFKKSTALSRADYLPEADRYHLAVAPMNINHFSHGALPSLRAPLEELE